MIIMNDEYKIEIVRWKRRNSKKTMMKETGVRREQNE